MSIKIYNSLSRNKETFTTLNPQKVTMYACGLTPQNHPHLGHAIAAIRFSIIRRYLQYKGYEVTFVENVTDIDDKIINRSKELNISPKELADKYYTEYLSAKEKLDLPRPQFEPKVSEYINQIISYVEKLVEKGFAYSTTEGDVYFDVSKKNDYGKLSGRNVDDMISGTRVSLKNNKKNPVDFALWKKDNTPNASWDSPWGLGRPGWHIECSVMSNNILGETIDIHCGGLDLLFPHHENEIAQCEAHNDKEFAKYWVHCGLLNVDGRKMSKSFGNFLTIEDSLEKYGKELITFVVLRHHYRSAMDFNEKLFKDNLNGILELHRSIPHKYIKDKHLTINKDDVSSVIVSEFEEAMDEDFNTPNALIVLMKHLKTAKKSSNQLEINSTLKCIAKLGKVLGLFSEHYTLEKLQNELLEFHQKSLQVENPLIKEKIEKIAYERGLARKNKDFVEADRLRDILDLSGIKISENKDGSVSWEFGVSVTT